MTQDYETWMFGGSFVSVCKYHSCYQKGKMILFITILKGCIFPDQIFLHIMDSKMRQDEEGSGCLGSSMPKEKRPRLRESLAWWMSSRNRQQERRLWDRMSLISFKHNMRKEQEITDHLLKSSKVENIIGKEMQDQDGVEQATSCSWKEEVDSPEEPGHPFGRWVSWYGGPY